VPLGLEFSKSSLGELNMAKRDSFLLRVDPSVLEAIRRWADDEMRSMNAQIEFILRSKLKDAGRLPQKSNTEEPKSEESGH
jgi:hypothetical protein